jgi:hypothetical protein
MRLNFGFDDFWKEYNNTVGIVDHQGVHNPNQEQLDYYRTHDSLSMGPDYDPNLFESQYTRYAQIIDTDNQDYMVMY